MFIKKKVSDYGLKNKIVFFSSYFNWSLYSIRRLNYAHYSKEQGSQKVFLVCVPFNVNKEGVFDPGVWGTLINNPLSEWTILLNYPHYKVCVYISSILGESLVTSLYIYKLFTFLSKLTFNLFSLKYEILVIFRRDY